MAYFKNFPQVDYHFGNAVNSTKYQDLNVYIDLLDQIKDDVSFYQYYNILDGERPDQISQKLYGTSDLHWTLFLLNPDIRLLGWPLSSNEVTKKVKADYPNTTLYTRVDLSNKFLRDTVVTGQSSGATGTILRRHLDLGQIVVEGSPSFVAGEYISATENDTYISGKIDSVVREWNAVHHYENDSAEYVDVNPFSPYVDVSADKYQLYNNTTGKYIFSTIYNDSALAQANVDSALTVRQTDVFSITDKSDISLTSLFGNIYSPSEDTFNVYYNGAAYATYDTDSEAITTINNIFENYITNNYDDIEPAIYTPITYYNRLHKDNESVTQIKVLKPEVASQIYSEYKKLLIETTPVEDVSIRSRRQQGLGNYTSSTDDKQALEAIDLVNSLLAGNN